MNTLQLLVAVMSLRSNRFRTIVLHGVGTAGMWQAWDTVRLFWAHGVLNELVGVILANWHRDVLDLRMVPDFRRIRRLLVIFAPTQMLESAPDGLLGDIAAAKGARSEFWTLLKRWWAELSSLAARYRSNVGLVVHFLSSGGGHLPITVESVSYAKRIFGGLHIGVFFLTKDTRLLENLLLPEYLGYPSAVGLPLIFLRDSEEARKAVPTLLMFLTAAARIQRSGQRRAIELLKRLVDESPVIIVAAAYRDIPVIPLSQWTKVWRWFRRLSIEVVRESSLSRSLSEAIAEVCLPSAICLDGISVSASAFQAMVGGGITSNIHEMVMTDDDRKLLTDAIAKAKVTLKEIGVQFPRGIEENMVFAPHFVKSDKPGHVRVAIFRLIADRSLSARSLVDAALEAEGLITSDVMAPSPPPIGAALAKDGARIPSPGGRAAQEEA